MISIDEKRLLFSFFFFDACRWFPTRPLTGSTGKASGCQQILFCKRKLQRMRFKIGNAEYTTKQDKNLTKDPAWKDGYGRRVRSASLFTQIRGGLGTGGYIAYSITLGSW